MINLFAGVLAMMCMSMMTMPAHAFGGVRCRMHFNLHGWSIFYKTASGEGTVTCSNGQRMHVHLRAKGGGLTMGKTSVHNGTGKFTGVDDIHDVLGHYAEAEAHAGADKSANAQVMTKGSVSLALVGKGRGWNLGIAFGAFIITS